MKGKCVLPEEQNIMGKILKNAIILNDYLIPKTISIIKQVVRGHGYLETEIL